MVARLRVIQKIKNSTSKYGLEESKYKCTFIYTYT